MEIYFYKYEGTGNDFVMIDNRLGQFFASRAIVERLCHRRFGIGADGLILLENDDEVDFRMRYFNSDGNESTMCGNGGRCVVKFAQFLCVFSGNETVFRAADGIHKATIDMDRVSLQMQNVSQISECFGGYFLHTGSPHHVVFCDDVKSVDVKREGAKIRYEIYGSEGANVNFVQILPDRQLKIRTYERGVEDETYSCGTGAVAAAIAAYDTGRVKNNEVTLQTEGGILEVSLLSKECEYQKVYLKGCVGKVFEGKVKI